ncbi:hypothetical protein PInf_007833 [Phytophthora infestans]|nr:hypothetical protein PInf_007833 [Phytophthora infestans]
MTSLDTLALYERILSLVDSSELHRSSNVVLSEILSGVGKSVHDVTAAFAKVEEVRDAVHQLEQGKGPSGRSATLLEVMNSTLQLQKELNDKLQGVVSGMKVDGGKVKEKVLKQEKRKREEQSESSSSDSSSSSSSSEDDEEDDDEMLGNEPKKQKQNGSLAAPDKKQSADLSLAHEALSCLSKIRKANPNTNAEISRKWVKTLLDLKLILTHQSSRDAHTTDNPAAEVTARALETAVTVLKKFKWTPERAEEASSLIAALTDSCSKNEVLRIYFHRVRAQLESLEMSIPQHIREATGVPKFRTEKGKSAKLVEDQKRQAAKTHSQPSKALKVVEEMQDRLEKIIAQAEQWQDGIFSVNQLDKAVKELRDVVSYRLQSWDTLPDLDTGLCADKLIRCIKYIQKPVHREKYLKIVNKLKQKVDSRR